MQACEFTQNPLFAWAKACFELRGVQAVLAKWNSTIIMDDLQSNESSLSFNNGKDERLLSNEDDQIALDAGGRRTRLPEPNGDTNGFSVPPWKAASITYSDLCAGVLLYACIRYIDSKDDVDAGVAANETKAKSTVDEPNESEEVDVLGGNYNLYSRIRRHSSPAARPTTTGTRERSLYHADNLENGVFSKNKDVIACRLRNLRAVMRRIQAFYADTLNALIVMPLPDLLLIARSPFPEDSGEEMKNVLLLLLGCAVQSDKKEEFIRKIKELDLGLQQAIVEQIKRVTDTVDCVLNVQALELDPSDRNTATVLHQLQRVIKERDTYANSTLELAASASAAVSSEHESDSGGSTSSSSVGGTSGGHQSYSSSSSVCNGDVCQRKLPESQQEIRENSTERHHLAVELADIKAKLRRTRQELEEKIEIASEYRDELAEKEAALAKLRQENLELLKDARAAKEYRDELDVLREKVDRLERLENECGKYKEKLMELDFCKTRVEELRAENHLLLESRHMLENQVDSLNGRLQKSASAEMELLQSQRLILDLQQELKSEREKLGDLLEQNFQLEKECQESLNKSSSLEKELSDVKAILSGGDVDAARANGGSLSEQLNDSAHSKLLKLELENQRLRSRLEDPMQDSVVEQLKAENDKLKKLLDGQQSAISAGQQEAQLKQQRQELERSFRQLEDQYRREIDDLKTENTSLTDELSLTRDRYDDSLNDERKRVAAEYETTTAVLTKDRDELRARREEMSAENKRLAQELSRFKSEMARAQDRLLENEKEKLASENRLYVLDRESRCAEKENAKLKQMLDAADEEFEKARTRILELEREKQKLEMAQARLEKAEEAVVGLEIEKRHFAQQAELETKKCAALREDLVKEKTQAHDLKKKLHTILHALGMAIDATSADASLLKAETLVQEHLSNSKRERDELQNRLQELQLREKQQSEFISSQNAEIAELRSKLSAKKDDTSSNSEKLRELERANAALLDENKHVKQQVYLLQEELRKMQNHIQSGNAENGMLRQDISELRLQMSSNALAQSDNAKLQVELRSLQLQVDVLEQDNTELQKQCNQWERDHGLVRRDFEHLQRQHGGLLQDHEQLQNLHEQLTMDFEKMQNEVLTLKSQLRQLKHDCLEHNDQLERLTMEKERLSNLQGRFEQERFEKEREYKTFALLQNEHSTIKKNYDDLKARYDFLTNEIEHMRTDYRNLRLDYNSVNLKSTQLQAQLTDSQDLAQRKELESVKLMHKCEMLTQLNSTLDEESRTLLRQMDVLIAQNQGLLTRALMDKDQYHAESKEFQEKLNALRRHKEKLEEKIMEQYKTMDSPNKRQKEKLTFMKKAKALVSRPSSRKSRPKNSLHSGSAVEDSAMSADEGGFCSTPSRNGDQYQNGYNRFSSRLRNRAESTDSRRSESSVGVQQMQSEYADIIRSSPLSVAKVASNKQTPNQQRRQFQHQGSPLNSPEMSHKRSHSSASTHGAESSLSSGTTAVSSGCSGGSASTKMQSNGLEKKDPPPLSTLPPFAPATVGGHNGCNLIPDHVSLTGSERAVDVPSDFLSHQKSSGNTGYGSPAAKYVSPPYIPPRSSSQQSSASQSVPVVPVPPPKAYQPSVTSGSAASQLPPSSPLLAMIRNPSVVGKPRPPPPPYPGPITRRQPPPLPNSPEPQRSQSSNLSRFRPDLAAEEQRRMESAPTGQSLPHPTSLSVLPKTQDAFAPAQTSTPNSDQRFLFESPESTQNAVAVYPDQNSNGGSAGPQPFRLFCATGAAAFGQAEQKESSPSRQPVGSGHHCYSNPYRKTAAQSFYENIDDLQEVSTTHGESEDSPPVQDEHSANEADTTASTVIPEGGRDTNSIWYEYGCV